MILQFDDRQQRQAAEDDVKNLKPLIKEYAGREDYRWYCNTLTNRLELIWQTTPTGV